MQGVVGFDGMSITRTTLGGLENGIQDAREYDWLYVNMYNMPRVSTHTRATYLLVDISTQYRRMLIHLMFVYLMS